MKNRTEKTYTVEEIEAIVNGVTNHDANIRVHGTAIIRQLLAQNQQLSAKVAEADRVEAMLKECDIYYNGTDKCLDHDGDSWVITHNTTEESEWRQSLRGNSTIQALTSLIGGAK